jgi:hypothetical protein
VIDAADGVTLLLADMRSALIVANEARYRLLGRLFGIAREEANVVTAITLFVLAEAVYERLGGLEPPEAPSMSDAALGLGVVREVFALVAGPTAEETPLFGTLVTIAVIGAISRPLLQRSGEAIAEVAQRMRAGFSQQYRHRGQLRRRR